MSVEASKVEASKVETSVVERVVLALEHAPQGCEAAARRRRALMYAEAIDDADEADALFRFGPRLQTCLASLGVSLLPAGRTTDDSRWSPRAA